MLSSLNRLRTARDIANVYRRGAYGAGAGVLSVKAVATGRADNRAVVVVGKKVDKRAVVRNRIRRRLTGELALIWTTLTPGCDIVVSVHADVSHLPTPQLAAHLGTALKRARVTIS